MRPVLVLPLALCACFFTSSGSDGDDGGSGSGSGGSGSGDDGGVPDNSYCSSVASWDSQWQILEEDILVIVNENRERGANCGSAGSFGPTGHLRMNGALRCAARKHSKDMVDRDFFDHTNPSGEDPGARIDKTGYDWRTYGENIAAGSPDAAGTMDQWMNSDGHCANIMNPSFEEIGVGYFPGGGYGHYWTQVFGTSR